jgi:hypothetical protein
MKFAAALALLCCSVPAFGGYSGYRLFTIDHTQTGTANSTNFTVLISGTWAEFATTANGGKVQNTVSCGVNSIACPADLIFTSDAGCSSPLAGWEFESYTAATGQIIAWVIVPTLSVSTNTLIYACAGNSAVSSFQGGSQGAAFDSNTQVVYHFPNGTTLSANDSSSGGCNATPANSPTAVTGEIGGAVHFNGSNQDVECSSFSWTGTSAVTVSFWNYVTSAEEQNSFAFTVGNSATTDPHRFSAAVPWGNGQLFWDYGNNGTGTGRVAATYTSYLNAWTYVTLVSTGSANTYQAIYLNGAVNVSASSSASSTVTGDLIVGAYPYANQYGPPYHNGNIDEFRISSVVRSASWILAEYNNQSSPSTFILRVFRQRPNPAGGMRLQLQLSLRRQFIHGDDSGGGDSGGKRPDYDLRRRLEHERNDIQRVLHRLHLGPGRLLHYMARCGNLLRPQRPGRNDQPDCSSEQHRRLVVQRQRVVLAALVGNRDR